MLMLSLYGGGGGPVEGEAASGCAVDVDTSGTVTELTEPEQQDNARTIIQVGLRLRVPSRGLTVAIATAMQESKLQNLSGGDRDSLGLFQQRPSSGWGTPAQIMDPVLAAEAFFGRAKHTPNPGLLDVQGWESMSITDAAQAVQRSAFPLAYAQWAPLAVKVVDQVTGGQESAAAPVCGGGGASAGSCKGPTDFSGYENGRIPAEALCALKFAPGHHLRSDAANAAEQLAAAYKAHFGSKLCVSDAYRDYQGQVEAKKKWEAQGKPQNAATPGTSNHGWGTALDLGCGVNEGYHTPQYLWIKTNGPSYGWHCPAWAVEGGSGPHEPWHIEYGTS
ncbi:M15 family metallopeptidase [Kineosporia sp. J2-2]|uniref:M15 family metallopeptidase n=1 Tax=Kineosporia corallincola TaxID=2835133 RepID=A0ABS5TQ93_9ACTN|nr:M15 family metallopeptidase [Kineosporia corallincola]MBT0771774.1 M15 family metallopeptidase [Kineosporia corallincola]